ncbi:MAG: NPCBM/NEW2 domain-containing protein, partial [Verrucomicrobia bacterium]|nr:NPCBM/NEW2 domain-containing protein [Verrucomicrobiota bacterium]
DPVLYPVAHRPCWYQEGEIVKGDGTYDDSDPYLQYGGNRVMTVGRQVIYGYHGEYWNNGQANQWMHFLENGLFIGQFGKANYPMPNRDNAIAGAAGNAFAPTLVTANGKVYLWHNDESVHAGVHRWRVDGLDQIQEINVAFGGAANQSPTCSLTAPANGASFTVPANLTLTATASDADGSIAKVEFFNGTTLLGTATTAPYTFIWTGVAAGSYTLTARATDNAGSATSSAQVAVNVTGVAGNAAPTVNLSSPLDGTTLIAPGSVTITASAADADGTVALIELFQNGYKLGQSTTSPFTVNTSLDAGGYTFTAKVTDNLGATTMSAGATVTIVNATNAAPTVSLTSPVNGANLGNAPASLTLNATAADLGGTVALVEFFQNGTKIGQSTAAPYSFTVSGLTAGTYAFTAKATDNLGAITTSAAVSVTVNSPVVPAGSATVNWNDVKQEIDGFGGATPGSAMWIKNFNEPARSQIMELLFSVTNGIGLSMVRVEPTADDHDAHNFGSTDAGTLQPKINSIEPTEGNWNWEGDESQVWFMQESKRWGASRYLASVWSAPPWMKANNSYVGSGGNAYLRPDKYQAYADYLSRYCREYKSRFGIDVTAISIQNEPDFPAWYQGCTWTAPQMVDFVKNYLGPTFRRDGVTNWVVAPENAHWSSMDRADQILADPGAASAVQVIANHGYDMSYGARPSVKAAGKRLWQTETSEISAPVNNSMANALMWARNIHNHLTVAETQAWFWWYLCEPAIDGTAGSLVYLTYDAPWYSANRRTFRYGRRLPAIGQYARFIRPGHVRLGVNANVPTDVLISAFKDPVGGQLSIVAINDTDSTQNISMSLSGAPGIAAVTPYVTSKTQDLEPQAPLAVAGGNFTAALGPRSVTTFVRNASPLPVAPVADAYLSDLPWVSSSIGDIDPPQRDLSAAGTFLQGATINLKGVNYAKGLGITAPSTIIYNLDGKCASFISDIGATQGGGVRFQVFADDQLLYDTSGTMSPNDLARNINVNVSGKKFLKLVASAGGSGNQGVWAGARVTYSAGPSATLTSPANNASFAPKSTVTLTANATAVSPATVSRVEFYNGATLLGSDTTAPYSFAWSSVASGTYSVTAKTIDSTGASATSSPITIIVNQPPTISLFLPSGAVGFTAPATITLNASASDADGTVAKVEFFNGTTLLGTDTTAPFSFTWTNVAAGTYTLKARATDNLGAATDSAPGSLTVNPGVGPKLGAGLVGNGTFAITLASVPGDIFILERSLDLRTWAPVATNTATGTVLQFTVPTPSGPAAFYRTKKF